MKRQYQTGLGTNQIAAAVATGTREPSYTVMSLARSGGQSTQLAESTDNGDGDIPLTVLGQALALSKSYLVVQTLVNFAAYGLSKDELLNEVKRLVIRYTLTGGYSGTQVYNYDVDDVFVAPSGEVLITKAIELL